VIIAAKIIKFKELKGAVTARIYVVNCCAKLTPALIITFLIYILNEKEANRRKRILRKMRIIQYPKITRV